MDAEDQDALFVSDEGELRWLPQYAGAEEVREPVHPGRPWRWEADGPHLDPEWQYWRRVKLTPPLQESIRRLLRERDEAREQLRFVMEMADADPRQLLSMPPLVNARDPWWQRFWELYRRLQEEDWFRKPPR